MFYHPDLFLQHSSNWFHLLSLINDQRWFLHFICVSSTVGCTHQTILLFSFSFSFCLSFPSCFTSCMIFCISFILHACSGCLVGLCTAPPFASALSLSSLHPSPSPPLLFFFVCSSSQSHSCFDSCAKLLLLSLLSQLQWDRNRWQPADPGWRDGGGASRGLLPHAGERWPALPGF